MYENIFSIADTIQLILMLAACYACYHWGRRDGVIMLATSLVEGGKLTEKDFDFDE